MDQTSQRLERERVAEGGTRHSLVVVEAGEGVTRIDVPPERWSV